VHPSEFTFVDNHIGKTKLSSEESRLSMGE
jgi:hypothetical protein